VVAEHRAKAAAKAAAPAPAPLTEEEKAERKRAKKQRQKETRAASRTPAASADSGTPAPTPTASLAADGDPIPVYGEGNPEAKGERKGEDEPMKEEDAAQGKFNCYCGKWLRRHTDFLFEHDWVGVFRGRCFECSEYEDPTEFKRASKASWIELQKTRGLQSERARQISYQGMVALTKQLAPEMSNHKVTTNQNKQIPPPIKKKPV
jgi:hypothetical protein